MPEPAIDVATTTAREIDVSRSGSAPRPSGSWRRATPAPGRFSFPCRRSAGDRCAHTGAGSHRGAGRRQRGVGDGAGGAGADHAGDGTVRRIWRAHRAQHRCDRPRCAAHLRRPELPGEALRSANRTRRPRRRGLAQQVLLPAHLSQRGGTFPLSVPAHSSPTPRRHRAAAQQHQCLDHRVRRRLWRPHPPSTPAFARYSAPPRRRFAESIGAPRRDEKACADSPGHRRGSEVGMAAHALWWLP